MLTRRSFLQQGANAAVAAGLTGTLGAGAARALTRRRSLSAAAAGYGTPSALQVDALRALGRTRMRLPDSRPNAALAAGTDTLPEIEHVVVLMMENHSYDNLFGMLGRGHGQRPRGDGFTLARDGLPTASNPYPNGHPLRAFRMPTTCQLHGAPSQEWTQSHVQYANGKNNGFVISNSGPVAMGYWNGQDLPFTYDLATQFPIGDRWFCSVLGQTDPNRRFLIAGTSSGMTDDVGTSIGNVVPDALLGAPPNGTIFSRLSDAGISWTDYYESFPTGATMELYPSVDGPYSETNAKPIAQFFSDAAAGKLPSFSLLDPNYSTQSQEDPQNIVVGEAFLESAVRAIGNSPAWRKTILIINYDEHGGYYDHVPPPPALAPDSVPPVVQPGESTYEGFKRYGFRVPSVIVSPYAKRNYVSHVVYDHASILAFVERKWNLASMTMRDANANDLTDFLDLNAIAKGQPTFPELPNLAHNGEDQETLACSQAGPGTIPPPPAAASPTGRLVTRYDGAVHHLHGLLLVLYMTHGTLTKLTVQLHRGKRLIASRHIARASTRHQRVVLRARHGIPPRGHYTLTITHGRTVLERRTVTVG